jgi:hypothetical protein
MGKDDHPEPEQRGPAIPASEMTNDNHPEPEQRGLSQQLQAAWTRVQESADTFQRVAAGLPEQLPRGRLQTAWARAIEGVGTIRCSMADELQEWMPRRRLRRVTRRRVRRQILSRPAVAMPSMTDLGWRDWMLFGCTGVSIVLALITMAMVVTDMLTRGAH